MTEKSLISNAMQSDSSKSAANGLTVEVESCVDVGRYTEHHAYSPARIAPPKHSLITTTPLTLSKLKQPTLSFKSKSTTLQNQNFQ